MDLCLGKAKPNIAKLEQTLIFLFSGFALTNYIFCHYRILHIVLFPSLVLLRSDETGQCNMVFFICMLDDKDNEAYFLFRAAHVLANNHNS